MTLHRAGEDYLKAVYVLQNDGGIVHSADIARKLKLSRASVSRGVRILLEEGLILMDRDKRLHLTKAGKKRAEQICEKHRVLEAWLIRAGVDAETAEKDACGMEHAVSDKSIEALRALLEEEEAGNGRIYG